MAPFEQDLTQDQLAAARDWIGDAFDDVDPSSLTDAEVTRGVARHYSGGIAQFLRDGFDPRVDCTCAQHVPGAAYRLVGHVAACPMAAAA